MKIVDLDERTCIVTGAGQGLGRMLALEMASLGARVIINARTREDLDAVAQQIREAGGTAAVVCGDVAETEVRERMVATALEASGTIDVLVNNAGMGAIGRLVDVTMDQWHRFFAVNATAVLHLSQLVLPHMLRSGYGRILNVSSGAGWNPTPGFGRYSPSRACQNMITKQLAQEVSNNSGVTVNGLAPGYVETDHVKQAKARITSGAHPIIPPERYQMFTEGFYLSYLGRPVAHEEFVAMALFLVSPLGGGTTGETINLGGGWFAR